MISNPGAGATISFPNTSIYDGIGVNAYADLDISAIVGARVTLVLLNILNKGGSTQAFSIREKGNTDDHFTKAIPDGDRAWFIGVTDAAGIIQFKGGVTAGTTVEIDLLLYGHA